MGRISRDNKIDFRPIGKVIQKARKERSWTKEKEAEQIGICVGYLNAIENPGKSMAIDTFVLLVTLSDLSADKLLLRNNIENTQNTSFLRHQIEAVLDSFSEKDLFFVNNTILAYI